VNAGNGVSSNSRPQASNGERRALQGVWVTTIINWSSWRTRESSSFRYAHRGCGAKSRPPGKVGSFRIFGRGGTVTLAKRAPSMSFRRAAIR